MSQPITNESPKESRVLLVKLEIPGRLPSWNDLLGMEHWARYKFKSELSKRFLSVLRASGSASSTKTTSAKSTMSIYADTLELYLQTAQQKRALKLAKKKQEQAKPSTHVSRSLPFGRKKKNCNPISYE